MPPQKIWTKHSLGSQFHWKEQNKKYGASEWLLNICTITYNRVYIGLILFKFYVEVYPSRTDLLWKIRIFLISLSRSEFQLWIQILNQKSYRLGKKKPIQWRMEYWIPQQNAGYCDKCKCKCKMAIDQKKRAMDQGRVKCMRLVATTQNAYWIHALVVRSYFRNICHVPPWGNAQNALLSLGRSIRIAQEHVRSSSHIIQ